MKFSTLKKFLVICGCVAISGSHAVEAKRKKNQKTVVITKAFLNRAKKLAENFIERCYPKHKLDHICMYQIVDVLNTLKLSFLEPKGDKESFQRCLERFIGFKEIMDQKIRDKETLKSDFEKYIDEYKTFLGNNITFEKFEKFLESLHKNFNNLCKDLMKVDTSRASLKTIKKIGDAFTEFQGRLPKDFTEHMNKNGGNSLNLPKAIVAIRTRLKRK